MEESGELDDDDKDHARSMRIGGDTSDQGESEEDKDRKAGRRSSGNRDDSADSGSSSLNLDKQLPLTMKQLPLDPFNPFTPLTPLKEAEASAATCWYSCMGYLSSDAMSGNILVRL
ncbi:hypothetical protein PsorP6_011512 [Peronosclerospora sorghi]|uniref:Uncharacterized protein n=1 Tax=Peronosclerospora sorghi TaxID=230839 RepID=A0ACC0WJ28_9STRA|nr:hypothetical protein PsorP6_011512 [Peronosclerospora sorghi]